MKNISANIGWLFFDKILRMGVGLFVGVWVARYLGPEQFGLFNYAIAFVALFGAFATLGLDTILVRNLVIEPDKENELMGSAFVLRLSSASLTLIVIIIAISLLRPGDTLSLSVVSILAVTLLFQSFDIIDYFFQSKVKSKYTVYARNAAFLIIAVGKIYFIVHKLSLIAFIWLNLAEIAMSAGLLIFAYYKYHENIIRWRFSLSVMKKLLQDSWPLILSSMMILLYMRVDQFMIGELLGDAEVGIYSSAIRLTEVWYFIPTAIVSSVFPSIIDAKRRDESLYNYRLQQLYTTMTWIGIAIALPMTFLSDFVIKLLYGDEFAGAGAVLSISIWCGIFVFQGIARGYWLLTENLQKYSLIYIGGACVLNIVLNLFLIPMLHSVGAAIATTISYGCSVIFFPLFIRQTKKSSIQILKSFIWKMN